jgi:hypothetical protein
MTDTFVAPAPTKVVVPADRRAYVTIPISSITWKMLGTLVAAAVPILLMEPDNVTACPTGTGILGDEALMALAVRSGAVTAAVMMKGASLRSVVPVVPVGQFVHLILML